LIDPRARWAREWDRAYLLACAAGLVVDPLFLYSVSLSGSLMCVFVDGWFAASVTALRCMVDTVHVWNLLMRLRMACAPDQEEEGADEEAKLQGGSGRSNENVGGAAVPAAQVPKSKRGLFLDVFVILPVMQVRAWVVQEWSQLSIPQFAFFVLFQMFHLFVR
jgi:cyclic nucleotide gated channel